ncbi:MAG: DUF2138 family protein, partial [Magnetococcales bacterium]|nr:DUF2138 family protein [Magnetococcales bacterium]
MDRFPTEIQCRMPRKFPLFIGLFGLLLLLLWWRGAPDSGHDPVQGGPLPADRLFHPDLVIQSRSLAQLPRDLLSVPLLRTLLSEDFLFYYQENESRLSLEGTLRRIAYEHQLSWNETVLARLLDSPAQLALWKGRDGKLKDYLLLLPKPLAARLLEPLAAIAASDRQLKLHNATTLPDGSTILLHRLQFQRRGALYFTTLRDQLAITNAPELLSDQSAEQQRAPLLQLFVQTLSPHSLGRSLQLPTLTGQHAIAVRAAYLSFGYQHFFPTLQGVRFHHDGQSWHTQILSRAPLPAPTQLWQQVPALAALCLALPVDIGPLQELLQPWNDDPQLPALLGALKSPAALCWYGDSALHTPLLVLPMTSYAPEWLPLLGNLFAQAIGSPVPLRDPKKTAPTLQPIQEESCPQGRIWRRTIQSAHGQSTTNH